MSGRIQITLRVPEDGEPINPDARIMIPAVRMPSMRTAIALQRGVGHKIMMRTANGLGDIICSEPTIRFAIETFKNCEFHVFTRTPEIFGHLKHKLASITSDIENQPNWIDYLCFDMIKPTDDIQWEFMSHIICHAVDFPSLCAFRCQMPNSYKEIQLPEDQNFVPPVYNCVAIHPGKTWQSRTFPKWWWDDLITELIRLGIKPVIIGANNGGTGTVNVDTTGCIDLRDKLSILETITLLKKHTKVLLTNDSSPLHMAASGDAWIGFVATVKHPDYITHWRSGEFGYKMKNFSRGGIWDEIDYCPNKSETLSAENVPEEMLERWLPDPKIMAKWASER